MAGKFYNITDKLDRNRSGDQNIIRYNFRGTYEIRELERVFQFEYTFTAKYPTKRIDTSRGTGGYESRFDRIYLDLWIGENVDGTGIEHIYFSDHDL